MPTLKEKRALAEGMMTAGSGNLPPARHPVYLEPPYTTETRLHPATYTGDHQALSVVVIKQFQQEETTIAKAEQLLRSLTTLHRPAAFEIQASGGTDQGDPFIRLQFVAHMQDAPTMAHLLTTHYPNSAITKLPHLTMADMALPQALTGCGIVFLASLAHGFLWPLTTITKLTCDPLSPLIAAFDHLPPEHLAMVQILFQPATGTWASGLRDACRNPYLKGGDYIDSDLNDRLFADKFQSPLFAVSLRLASTHEATFNPAMLAWLDQYANPPQGLIDSEHSYGEYMPNALGARVAFSPGFLLNTEELAALVHLPAAHIHTEHLQRITTRTRPAPRTTAEPGSILLGTNTHRGQQQLARISAHLRPRHCYIAGASGTGKSTLILNMIKQDIAAGHGVGLLDPHGDLTENILSIIPPHRINDVVYFNPSDKGHPPAFNFMQCKDQNERERNANETVTTIQKFFPGSWGVRMNHILVHTLLTVTKAPNATLLDVRRMLTDEQFRYRVTSQLKDETLLTFWTHEFPGYPKDVCDPILNKLSPFLLNTTIRNIICQRQSKYDFDTILNTKQIFLANLSTGLLGESVAGIFGTFIMSKVVNAAFRRAAIPEHRRVPFYLYVDEFQNFMDLTVGFEQILAEARKYRLVLAGMANQYVGQLTDSVRQAIFGNVGTLLTFRLGVQDARLVANEFGEFTSDEILSLEMGQAICRVGGTQTAFNLNTAPPPKTNPPAIAAKIVATSRQRYTTPRQHVEQLFVKRTIAPAPSKLPSQPVTKTSARPSGSAPQQPPPTPSKQAEHISPDLIDDDLVLGASCEDMTQEPTTAPINEDDNEPATKEFVRQEIHSLEERTETKFNAVLQMIKDEGEKTRQYFDVVVENIHQEVAGANKDEITLIRDQKLPDHEERIQILEKHAGLPIGSVSAK